MLIKKLVRASVLATAAIVAGKVGYESIKDNGSNSSIVSEYKALIKFEDDKKEIFDEKIARAYIPKNLKGKPLFILILGQVEGLDYPSDISGIIHFYERLVKEDKGTVLLFRTGLAEDEIGSMLSSKEGKSLEPNKVFKQTKEIINDFIHKLKPSEIRFAGYSWGGGTIFNLSQENDWQNRVPVKCTVMIDPIYLGSFSFGAALRTRAEFKDSPGYRNFHVYQRRDDLSLTEWIVTIQGNYPIKLINDENGNPILVKDERPGDFIWQVSDTDHLRIDDVNEVREKGYEFLIK